jgi:hypothetical protein
MTTTTMEQALPLITRSRSLSKRRLGIGNRLTCALRPMLSIPHMILVGPGAWFHRLDSAGLIGAAAYVLAVVNWFSILVSGQSIKGHPRLPALLPAVADSRSSPTWRCLSIRTRRSAMHRIRRRSR